MVKKLNLKPLMSDEKATSLMGTHLADSHCKTLIEKDADVYCAKTGLCLAKFRKGVIPKNVQRDAYEALKKMANTKQDNRGVSAGWDKSEVDKLIKREGAQGYVREKGSFNFERRFVK